MDQLQSFKNELFEVSAKIEGNEILFDVEQVAKCLGFTQTKGSREYIRWETVNRYLEKYVSQRVGKGDLIPEPLVYKLAFKASNELAERFQDWLAVEVIPTIRKTGGYVQENRAIDFVNAWLPHIDDNSKQILASTLEENRKLITQNKKLTAIIERQRPKVLFAESVQASENSILVRELARMLVQKGIDTGERRLFEWLRNNGYLIRQKGDSFNLPTQRSMDLKLFEIHKRTITDPDGSIRVTRTPRVTAKGQIYFLNKLLNEKAVI